MEITIEQVRQRQEAIEQRKANLLADLNATIGALQDCEYWLGVLEKQPTEQEKPE